MVRLGLVFAGEIWVMLAAAKIGWVCWLTLELRSPTTADDLVVRRELGGGVLADVGLGLVVDRGDLELPAGTALVSLACLTASSTECWMPLPRADRSPESGR
jgi:hypothetical protein